MAIHKVEHIDDRLVVEHEFHGHKDVLSIPHHEVPSLPEHLPEVRGYHVPVPQASADVVLVANRDNNGKWGYDAYRTTKCAGS